MLKASALHGNGRLFQLNICGNYPDSAERRKTFKKIAGYGLAAGGAAIAAPAVGILALNAAGFTAAGVAAGASHLISLRIDIDFAILISGSLAAAVQSAVYGGFTTGLFSVFQSIGATAVVSAGSLIGGGTTLAAGAGILASNGDDDPDDEDSSTDSDNEETGGENPDKDVPPPYKE